MTSCVSLVFAGRGRRSTAVRRARVRPARVTAVTLLVFAAVAALDAGAAAASVESTTSAARVPSTISDVVARPPGTSVTLQSDSFDWQRDTKSPSAYNAATATNARDVWAMRDGTGAGITGAGIGVALIDSGVVPVSGFDASRVINGPDLSFESQSESLRYLDTFGHGTHLAGIIAGRDPVMQSANPKNFVGVAPGATLVSVKVASAEGATDVSQVIAAIDWVVQHKDDPGLNIRILNLSFGTSAMQDAALDPLSYAAEVAWRSGIVVVVAAGNDGNASASLTNPAIDPFVIAVGAVDQQNALDRHGVGDTIASFSSRGSTSRAPDLVAPGRSIVSLRDPGSFIDTTHPEGRADDQPSLFRGSGTSQAAAVVSGAVALLLDQRPELTPDQVKRLLVSTAKPLRRVDRALQGAGQLRLRAAIDARTPERAAQRADILAGDGVGIVGACARQCPRRGCNLGGGARRRAGHLRSAVESGRLGAGSRAGRQLARWHVERPDLDGRRVERLVVDGEHMEIRDVDRLIVEGEQLAGRHVDREQLAGRHVEREQLAGRRVEREQLAIQFVAQRLDLPRGAYVTRAAGSDCHRGRSRSRHRADTFATRASFGARHSNKTVRTASA